MKWLRLLALAVILITAAFFRTWDLKSTPPGLYPDEAMNGSNALEANATGSYRVFYPENNGREGLFINIQALTLKLIGKREPWVLRLPSAIFGILTVAGVYFLGREMFSESTGLLASLFIAVAHWHVIFSRIGLRVISAPFFLTWSLVFLWIAFKKLRASGTFRESRPWFLLAGLLYGLGFHSYIAYRVTPFIVLTALAFFYYNCRGSGLNRECKLAAVTFAVIALVIAAPLAAYFVANPSSFHERSAGLSVFSADAPLASMLANCARTAGMLNLSGDLNWRHNVSGKPELFLPVGLLFWAAIALAIGNLISSARSSSAQSRFVRLFANQDPAYPTLLAWLAFSALPVVLSNERLPHALRSLMMVPSLMILAAEGAVWLARQIRNRAGLRVAGVAVGVLVLAVAVEGYHTFFVTWAKDPHLPAAFGADYVETARQIQALPDDVPKYVVIEARGMAVRGIPVPAQTVIFLTDTFSDDDREKKNLIFLTPRMAEQIPPGSHVWTLRDIP